jgi:prolipoprotein diacylglyceryltransferase
MRLSPATLVGFVEGPLPRHPAQLYESVCNLGLAIALYRSYRSDHGAGPSDGRTVAGFLLGYGLIRMVLEFVRADSQKCIGPFSMPQVIASVLILTGGSLFVFFRSRARKEPLERAPALERVAMELRGRPKRIISERSGTSL